MLSELRIENFAIIDRLEISLKTGLIAFTGETGAGKSIIVDALETLLGGRAEALMIRSMAERANIEAEFRILPQVRERLHSILQREDLLDDPEYLTLGREIRSNGRNVARVNGRTVSAGLLREIGEQLVDLHGQSEHLSLLRVREHLSLLDRYAGVEDLHVVYLKTFRELEAARKELHNLRQAEGESARLSDLLSYQINEIQAARLQPGEEQDLRAERTRLANAEGLATLSQQALLALDEGTPESPASLDLFGKVVEALTDLTRIDPSLDALAGETQEIFDRLSDLARELRNYAEEIEFNPKRLDQVEERLDLIHNLKRKYGQTIPEVLSFAEKAREQLETITHAEARIAELENQEKELLSILGEKGLALSNKRREAASLLKSEIERELLDLQMPGARFEVDFKLAEDRNGIQLSDGRYLAFDNSGLDKVEFLIAPNPGEGLKPLTKIASGGETSRLMLALKNVLARADQVPLLIFDEIDQGIGGRVGAVVGNKLWQLAHLHQVICITHLPQLAAFAGQHFLVQKQVKDERTLTAVEDLHGEARVRELAQMLGEVSEGTLQSAREMLESTAAMMQADYARP
jgi:DNA repair protein RecN (Recombination protein N)